MSLRHEVAALLRAASEHRVSLEERVALAKAAERIMDREPPDLVASTLPHMRYAKGITMALGWAAEAMETNDEAWQRECMEEFARYRDWYLELT